MECADLWICMLGSAEGGRRQPIPPRDASYLPHLIVRGSVELLGAQLIDGPALVQPGESANVRVRLIYPAVDYAALMPGVEFAIVVGPNTVGRGRVQARGSSMGASSLP